MFRIIHFLIPCIFSVTLSAQTVRSIDGTFNNAQNIEWGSTSSDLYPLTQASFADGISAASGADRKNPREISNYLFAQEGDILDERQLSDYIWVFGQFIDHEIILVESDVTEPLGIEIPADDQVFSVDGPPISMFRSRAALGSGTSIDNVRRYSNEVTGFIDGSAIYGSEAHVASWIRTYADGKLRTSEGNLLPWNTLTGEFNAPRDPRAPRMADPVRSSNKHFIAGDQRANENPLLIAFHTIFVREHNRLCEEYKLAHPGAEDEEIYQYARRMVGGFLQSIVYNEWLPAMGLQIPRYNGYRPEVNPQISNVFSAAAFRMGYTLTNSNLLRLERDGDVIASGNISLKDAFFNPLAVSLAGGVEPYLRGMGAQVQQKMDCHIVDDVRNFLFESPSMGGMDLAAISINRGRERGLGDFNSIRDDIGLPLLTSFDELTSDLDVVTSLREVYGSVDNIDPWVGMLAEYNMPGAMFGNTIMVILEDQFQRLRDGDKFYFEVDPVLTDNEKFTIQHTTLRDIIMRNTDIKVMQDNVFIAAQRGEIETGPEIPEIDLYAVAYPNPSYGKFVAKIFAEADYPVDVDIFDDLGRLVSSSTFDLIQGDNVVAFDIQRPLGASFYNVLIKRGVKSYLLRVFVQ